MEISNSGNVITTLEYKSVVRTAKGMDPRRGLSEPDIFLGSGFLLAAEGAEHVSGDTLEAGPAAWERVSRELWRQPERTPSACAGAVGREEGGIQPAVPRSADRLTAVGTMRPEEERPVEGGACVGVSQLELLKLRAADCIDEAAERLGALSRAIWSKPELAYEEHHAHGVLTRFFESEPPAGSWAVQPHYQLATAFRAEWGPPPRGLAATRPLHLGFLCEYDALPDIGHACGHNLIAEVGAAAALGVKGCLESLPGPPLPVKVRWGPSGGLPSPVQAGTNRRSAVSLSIRPLPARRRCRGKHSTTWPLLVGRSPGSKFIVPELPTWRHFADFCLFFPALL